MQRVEWVLFDLGGVLVEVNQSRIFEGLGEQTGLNVEEVRQRLLSSLPLNTDFIVTEFLPHQLTKAVNQALGTSLTESAVVSAVNAELGETIQTTAALLPRLQSRSKVGCLSNTNSIHWDYLLGSYAFMQNFDRRFASQLIGHAKPGRAIYDLVRSQLAVQPHEILFFDDKEENVATAKQLGWNAMLYRNHATLIDDLREWFPEL